MKKEILNSTLNKVDLTVRTRNCLMASGIDTFGDLLEVPYHRLLKIDGIGAKAVIEIIELVNSHGYKLDGQEFFYKKKAALPWVQKLIEEAVLAEREACAKVCEDINAVYNKPDDAAERVATQWCLERIRARGQQ